MDLMSVGEIPQPLEEATAEQQRTMTHYHMLCGLNRVDESDATAKMDHHRTMGKAFEAERRTRAARARAEEQEAVGEAARLGEWATARMHLAVKDRAWETRYNLVLEACENMLPGQSRQDTMVARAVAEVRKRRHVQEH
jgi:hypothetical protein